MIKGFILALCLTLITFLLASCQSENIPLVVPTVRPSSATASVETASPVLTKALSNPLAMLIELQGTGRWRASVATRWFPASINQTLLVDNQVLTLADSKAVIEYQDGLLVHIAPKTLFTFTELKQSSDHTLSASIRLLIGELFMSHNSAQGAQININTDAGIAGVRGTMMSAKVTISGRLVVTCLDGICTLENKFGQIDLEAGQQAEIPKDTIAPIPLGLIADYQFNEWFANQPAALSVPEGCNLDNSSSCRIELDCDPTSGMGCQLPEGCNESSGLGCELSGGCNPVTGEGCELPTGCNLLNGQGCQLTTGCNLVSGEGCAPPLNCDLLTGIGCKPEPGCDLGTGQGCELPSGCNPVTGLDCLCPTGNICAGMPIPSAEYMPTSTATLIPTNSPTSTPTILITPRNTSTAILTPTYTPGNTPTETFTPTYTPS
ncbi:MAG: FecR family protein, partial [Anaerolineales bacterium]